jgi:hypothetical protein
MNEIRSIRLDPTNLELFRDRFLARTPEFGDFRVAGDAYRANERAYKDEFAALCKAELLPDLFPETLTQSTADQVVSVTLGLLRRRLPSINGPQNFIAWRVIYFLPNLNAAERLVFARSFGDMLFGEGDSPDRMQRFVENTWTAANRTLRRNPYAFTRIFPTVFLMAFDPAHDIAVRTEMFDTATEALLGKRLLQNARFDAAQYRSILAFAQAVRRELDLWAWRPRDLIDVQTFLWVATSKTYGEPLSSTSQV